MPKPLIARIRPTVIELEPGSYWWCACGRSNFQPWCDGSHKDTEFKPVETVIEEKKKVAMCNCKRTRKSPFCDGSHGDLEA